MESDSHPDLPTSQLGMLAFEVCSLRTKMADDYDEDESINLEYFLTLGSKLAAWPESLPEEWDYQRIEDKRLRDDLYDNLYHVYPDFAIASIWNHYRCVYFMFNQALLEFLDHQERRSPFGFGLHPQTDRYRQRALSIIDELASDMCASVPFHLTGARSQPPPIAARSLILWPLYVVGLAKGRPAAQRRWVINQLVQIRQTAGLPLAMSMAQVLKGMGQSEAEDRRLFRDVSGEADEDNFQTWAHERSSISTVSSQSSETQASVSIVSTA